MDQIALLFISFFTFFPSTDTTVNTKKEVLYLETLSKKNIPDVENIYTKVEKMPLFGDCSRYVDAYYKNLCSLKNIRDFIDNEVLHYPIQKDLKKDTKTYVSYTINEKGLLTNPYIELSCGHKTLDNLALNIVKKMKQWQVGKHQNQAVKVKITSVVVFKK